MSLPWEPLPWDSDFFGFGIGRVELAGADRSSVEQVEAEARRAGILCLYGHLDPDEHETSFTVQTFGYRLVEASARFDLPRGHEVPRPETDAVVRRGTEEDLPAVEPAMAKLARWSRYAVDPRFGLDAARRMNVAWIGRAARSVGDEHRLTVAEDHRGVVAFMGMGRNPRPFADTVATTAPGSGAVQMLMREAFEWAGDDGLGCGWAASRNIGSFRFVEGCGFRVAEVRYVYHRWLDEAPQGGR